MVWPDVHLPSQTQFGSLDVESSAQHDAYLERMKAEAEDRDSEDGEEEQASLLCTACLPVCGCWYSEVCCAVLCVVVCAQRTQTLWLEIAVRMTLSELQCVVW